MSRHRRQQRKRMRRNPAHMLALIRAKVRECIASFAKAGWVERRPIPYMADYLARVAVRSDAARSLGQRLHTRLQEVPEARFSVKSKLSEDGKTMHIDVTIRNPLPGTYERLLAAGVPVRVTR